MFDHLFENRNTTVTNLLKLGDCLGRSLRENIELFSIDSESKNVAYLSESGKVISGSYDFKEDLSLTDITVQDSKIFTDNKVFDTYVDDKVSHFVGDLSEDRYGEADHSFGEILTLWKTELSLKMLRRVDEKSTAFGEEQTIIDTEEFQRFLEIMPQVTEFLEEEKEKVQAVQEVENAIKLSNSVSRAFNFPRLSFETLQEAGGYRIAKGINKSVYDLICKQELVKKELLESKKNFEDVWATNPKIRQLATLIFEDSDEKILEHLVEAVVDVPYLALTTKRQLLESLSNAFSLTDHNALSTKELKAYVSRLYEMKKPLKSTILNLLNEKYGINVQNLKETATFTGLANTQVVIFEALTRLAPKGSVVKSTLSEITNLLKNKNGVEVIDVNDVLQECFEACGYEEFCADFTLVESLSFEDILDSEVNISELLEKTKKGLLLSKKKKKGELDPGDEDLSPEQLKAKKDNEKHEKVPGVEGEMEDDSIRASEGAAPFSKPAEFSTHGDGDGEDGEEDEEGEEGEKEGENGSKKESSDLSARLGDPDDGDMDDPKSAKKKKTKKKVKEEAEVPPQEGEPAPPQPAPEDDAPKDADLTGSEAPKEMTPEDFVDALKDMDELLKGMSAEAEEDEVAEVEDDEQEA